MLFASKDCGAENEIRPKEPLRCKECGHRIMYKQRTKKSKPQLLQSSIYYFLYILII
jgi:DNA-directed RNA polymerase subunit RPC12/RpoP